MPRAQQLPLFPPPGRSQTPAAPLVLMPTLGQDATLGAAIGAFQAHMVGQGFSGHTVRSFQSDLHLLTQFIGPNIPVRRLHTRRLEEFLHWLVNERGVPCNAKSYARRVTTLKVFFKWLFDTEVLKDDPAASIVHVAPPSRLPDVLYDDQVESLVAEALAMYTRTDGRDTRPHLLLQLLLSTAIKKSECMAVALEHIDLQAGDGPTLYIRYANPRYRHKERKLRLSAEFVEALGAYREQYNPQVRLFECTPRNLEYVLTDLGQRAGAPEVSFEILRMTAAVRDYRAGMAPDVLRQKLGLSTITWADTGDKIRRLAQPPL
ncbi:MAG: site-specific integrase [Anaerolineae bacterium]